MSAVFQQASNPSIERTSQRPLRALCAAAHVERWAPEVSPVLRGAPSSVLAVVRFVKVVNVPSSGGTALAVA